MDTKTVCCLGLIINPIAGLGGRVGLKGSDGAEVQRRAMELGAQPRAQERALEALRELAGVDRLALLTYPGEMGADAAHAAGLRPTVIGAIRPGPTTAEDTRRAAHEMQEAGVQLLLFAGGDGTARDIYAAVGTGLPVLGIPAGVKMHSAVYAAHPRGAGELARLYLQGRVARLREAEVMDIDEEAFRQGAVAAQLYGYLKVPYRRETLPGAKARSPIAEADTLRGIARAVVERMAPGRVYIAGPGTTMRAILAELGLEKTLLGVDAVLDGRLVARDAGEAELLEAIRGRPASVVVSPVGGQGYLLGRGNQQISPRVLRAVLGLAGEDFPGEAAAGATSAAAEPAPVGGGAPALVVASAPEKLHALAGRPLLVDTGDAAVDRALAGHLRVVTGYREEAVYRVGG
jgi:predicted polyphosphate/ATP-dependent NAD kinase